MLISVKKYWKLAKPPWIKVRMPMMGIIYNFLAINQPLWVNWAEIFYWRSGDYYLWIGHEKTKVKCLFSDFDCRPVFAGKWAWLPQNPTKMLAHLLGKLLSRDHIFKFSGLSPLCPYSLIVYICDILFTKTPRTVGHDFIMYDNNWHFVAT